MITQEIKNIPSSKKDLRKFGIVMGIAMFVITGILFWIKKELFLVVPAIGLGFILLGLVVPVVLKPVQKLWMTIAIILGWFMTRVILSILYFLVFTPMALIAKVVGKQFLELKWEKSQPTYWNYRKDEFDKAQYEKQF